MAFAAISPETVEAIKGAPNGETHESLAGRLGISVPTVRRYRKEARQERQEAARAIIAEDVQEHLPDALSDLHDLRQLAGGRYRKDADPRQGALWLNAIEATLKHVGPDDSALDAEIAAELGRLSGAGEAPPAGEASGAT